MMTLGVWIALTAATATAQLAAEPKAEPSAESDTEPSAEMVADAADDETSDPPPDADSPAVTEPDDEAIEDASEPEPEPEPDADSDGPAQAEPASVPPPRLPAEPASGLPPFHPLRIRWGITAPVIGTTALGFFVMEGLGTTGSAPTVCTPPVPGTCPDLGRLEPIDRIAVGHYDGTASTASDVLVAAALVGPALASMAEAIVWARADRERGADHPARRGAARFGYHTAIWAESIGVAMFTTNVLKAAFGRPRPLTHLGEAALLEEGLEPDDLDGDFGRSFPSGHATLAFSSVVAGATLLTLEQCRPTDPLRRSGTPRCARRTPRQRAMLGLMWGLGTAGAATTAALRVVAGKHYPTDVLMGAAIGATSGIIIPLLHRRRAR